MPETDLAWLPVPAGRRITIRDLLTHTSGVSYGGESRLAAHYKAAGPSKSSSLLHYGPRLS